jgi:16S rRNA (cytidine1402-2'-O)-methyltransferase
MTRQKSFTPSPAYTLYFIATPIGNLDELSKRAIDTMTLVDKIACEDTRITGKLLHHLNLQKPLIPCHEHNENVASAAIIQAILKGEKIAYVSDAGYPGISDPGQRLLQQALKADIHVVIISGPSAILNALVGSGLNTERFYFHGFLLSKEGPRLDELKDLYHRKETLIFYESPHRIDTTLKNMLEILGNRQAVIARELTKLHEEYIRGTLQELSEIESATLKGEMVILVEGNKDEMSLKLSDDEIRKLVQNLTETGISMKDAIRQVADMTLLNKNYIYKLMHRN